MKKLRVHAAELIMKKEDTQMQNFTKQLIQSWFAVLATFCSVQQWSSHAGIRTPQVPLVRFWGLPSVWGCRSEESSWRLTSSRLKQFSAMDMSAVWNNSRVKSNQETTPMQVYLSRQYITINSGCNLFFSTSPPKTCHLFLVFAPTPEALASESLLQLLRDSLDRKNLWPADVFHLLDQEKQGFLLQAPPFFFDDLGESVFLKGWLGLWNWGRLRIKP